MTTVADTTTDLIAAAKMLRPQIEAYRDESERERSLPKELMRSIIDSGVLRAWVPRSIGGLETDVETLLRVIEEVAQVDGAAGWNVMIAGSGALFAGFLPESVAGDIFGDPRAIVAGAFAPKGRAEPVDGGYRVTGRWPLASGCHHAQWLGGGSLIFDGETPRMAPDGIPDLRVMLAPAAECQVHDTWYSAGLRGTGSHDIEMRDLFIPAERAFALLNPTRHEPGALYRAGILPIFSTVVASVALGIARGALDAFEDLAGKKAPTFSVTLLRDRGAVQAKVGEAEALLRSGRAFLFETVRDAWATMQADQDLSEEQRALISLSATHAARSSAEAVDIVYTLGGATSIYTSSRLERCFRDVHTITQHVGVSFSWYERTGQYFLGMGIGGF